MVEITPITQFIHQLHDHLVIDVRTPQEFAQGHIPGAYNVPLFSNEARALIGTTYKQVSKEDAMMLGLKLIGPHMTTIVATVQELHKTHFSHAPKKILLYCWRGGMRSTSAAWLLNFFGYDVTILEGGYKKFKNHLRSTLTQPYLLYILGGKTGCNKTALLYELITLGEQVIDLEKIAHHKGSVFGGLHGVPQPTQEQFENQLGMLLMNLDHQKPIWIEDESPRIGNIMLPRILVKKMKNAPVFYINIPQEQRIKNLIQDYGMYDVTDLKNCVIRLEKKIGNLTAQRIYQALDEKDFETACALILEYYDKTYTFGISKRTPETIITINPSETLQEIATTLVNRSYVHHR